MDEEPKEKLFQTVDIVILMLITVPKDISTLFADLIVAVPVVGQVYFFLDKLFTGIVWAIIQIYFFWKTRSFGRPGLVNVIGGLFTTAGLPGAETISTGIAIYLANHPEVIETATKVVGVAAVTVATGGAGGAAVAGAKATGAAGGGAGIAAGAAKATGGATGSVTGTAAGTGKTGAMAREGTATGSKTGAAAGKEVPPEALGGQKEPMERIKDELLQETPQTPAKKEGGEEENVELG